MRTKICAQRKMNDIQLYNTYGKKKNYVAQNDGSIHIPHQITHAKKGKVKMKQITEHKKEVTSTKQRELSTK